MSENKIFQIKFHDAGIHPSNIRARDLALVLQSLDDGLSAIVETANPGMFAGGIGISLVNIKEGCAALEFDYGNYAINYPAFIFLTESIRDSTLSRLPTKAKSIIDEVKIFNSKYRCSTEFWSSKNTSSPDAIISPPELIEIPKQETIKGITTIYGEVIRVGGQRGARAELKLNSGSILEIKIKKDTAKALGSRMYETVGLQGEAVWNISSGEIESFTVDQMLNYVETPLNKSFELLKNEFGSYFEDIDDVDSFVSSLRED